MDDDALAADPRKLLYFAAIIENGSFKKAATALNMSQPALSTSMDRLEAALGVKVLHRSPRGVAPTEEGEALYFHAWAIRDEVLQATTRIQNMRTGDDCDPMIRIGTLPSLADQVLPTAIMLWREKYPDRDFRIEERGQFDLLTGLLAREFDFVIGFTESFHMDQGLRRRVIFRDRLCVVVSSTHPLASATEIGWRDVVKFPWILVTHKRSQTLLTNALRSAGVTQFPTLAVCSSVGFVKSLLQDGNHVAALPKNILSNELNSGQLHDLQLSAAGFDRSIAVYQREGYTVDEARRDLIQEIEAAGIKIGRQAAA